MQVQAYLNGILPRSDEALKLGSAWLRGRATKEEFDNLLLEETRSYIELQTAVGLDYVVDGQLFWQDFLRPIAQSLKFFGSRGDANENPVTRQIYTNTFYRRPFINKIPTTKKIIDETHLLDAPADKRKVILPSPFALLHLSEGAHWEKGTIKQETAEALLGEIAEAFNAEIKRLEKQGVSFVQFTDPSLAHATETELLWDAIEKSLATATKGIQSVTSLHLYNGNLAPHYEKIKRFPVQRIGLDAYTTDLRELDSIKFLELGVVNAKNSRVEKPEVVARLGEQILDEVKPGGLALVPNRPLELVPQPIAYEKISCLAKAAAFLNA